MFSGQDSSSLSKHKLTIEELDNLLGPSLERQPPQLHDEVRGGVLKGEDGGGDSVTVVTAMTVVTVMQW